MELRNLIFGALFVSFCFALFGYSFSGITTYYNVTDTGVSNYSNFTAIESMSQELGEKIKSNPTTTTDVFGLVSISLDALKIFFSIVNIVFAFFNAMVTALGLPSFITGYVIVAVTAILIFAIFYAISRSRF